jgi:hypothetical protein
MTRQPMTGDGSGDEERVDGERGRTRRGVQRTLHRVFETVSEEEKESRVRREYRAQERKMKRRRSIRQGQAAHNTTKRQQHRRDRTVGKTTQNVRGLATHMMKLSTKLQGFKKQHMRGNRDVILLQETHLNPEEHDRAARQYVAMWTQRLTIFPSGPPGLVGRREWRYWSNMKGWRDELWTEHPWGTGGQKGALHQHLCASPRRSQGEVLHTIEHN